jgi:ATP-dependent Clp protease, protease subunit
MIKDKEKISPKKVTGASRKVDKDNVTLFMDNNIDIDGRVIHIHSDIDSKVTSDTIKGIQLMIRKGGDKPIHIYINSYGGDIYSGLGLYSFIRSVQDTEIYTYNIGYTASAATIIFLAGDKRYAYRETSFMFHTVNAYTEGKLFPNHVNMTEAMKEVYKRMCHIYAKTTKKNYKWWYSHIKFEDREYWSEDALALGVVDEII